MRVGRVGTTTLAQHRFVFGTEGGLVEFPLQVLLEQLEVKSCTLLHSDSWGVVSQCSDAGMNEIHDK